MLADSSRPNYLLFMTDGEPTVGERSETQIAANAARENKVNARLFAIGVGFDVNARLLDRLARELRGTSTTSSRTRISKRPCRRFTQDRRRP
jgi:Ca-activated chloride channel homolog